MLEDRRSEILRALVEEHIRTGEAVSSRAIVERARLNVSSATVRNDLAGLESEGFAVQPHTSAGRVPTARAYRYYVDHLGPGRLKAAAQMKVQTFFGDVHLELSKLLSATSDLLAEITDLPAVVVSPGLGADRVRALHAVQILKDQILLVVVTDGGRVLQNRGRVRVPVTPNEVEEAQQVVATAMIGKGIDDESALSTEALAGLSNPVRECALTILDSLHLAVSSSNEVFVGGAQRFAGSWDDVTAVQRVLDVLQREAEVMKLLASASETSIQIGAELPVSEIDLAVVSKRYDSGSAAGSVGVIGPMRMNYRRAISAVEEVTRELEELISESES
jgi:heat-inducible transcriptional repressor